MFLTDSKNYLFSLTAQKMKFSIKYFFSKFDQNRRKLRIWSHLLKNPQWKTSFFVQWLTINDHYNSRLSKVIQFEKKQSLNFLIFEKICKRIIKNYVLV